jgi:hypothetical protein
MPTIHKGAKSKDHDASPSPENHGRTAREEEIHQHKDELLDQGVEETFPASDPVAVKHIT